MMNLFSLDVIHLWLLLLGALATTIITISQKGNPDGWKWSWMRQSHRLCSSIGRHLEWWSVLLLWAALIIGYFVAKSATTESRDLKESVAVMQFERKLLAPVEANRRLSKSQEDAMVAAIAKLEQRPIKIAFINGDEPRAFGHQWIAMFRDKVKWETTSSELMGLHAYGVLVRCDDDPDFAKQLAAIIQNSNIACRVIPETETILGDPSTLWLIVGAKPLHPTLAFSTGDERLDWMTEELKEIAPKRLTVGVFQDNQLSHDVASLLLRPFARNKWTTTLSSDVIAMDTEERGAVLLVNSISDFDAGNLAHLARVLQLSIPLVGVERRPELVNQGDVMIAVGYDPPSILDEAIPKQMPPKTNGPEPKQ